MKSLDRYIIRELISPIFFCSMALVSLILIADVFDNLDEFLRFNTPASVILKYYLYLIPYAFVQTIPWATWLGTLFLMVNLGFHNEILAMKAAGLKIFTIIRPILFLGFLIGIFTFIVSDRLVPVSYRVSKELNDIYIEKKTTRKEGRIVNDVTFRSSENHLYYFRLLALNSAEAQDVILLWLDDEGKKTRQKISAKSGIWKDGHWVFSEVIEYQIDSRGRILGEPKRFPTKAYPDLTATPDDLGNASRESIFLTYREMKKSMGKLAETGVNIHSERVDLHDRLAAPWQSIVMMLVVIPLLGPTHSRRGIAGAVLACIALIFVYHVSSAVSLALGKSGILFPFLSAWGGTILFSVLALINLDRANF